MSAQSSPNQYRMPGRIHPSWCPSCHQPPGPDCPDVGKDGRWVRRELSRELRREER